MHYEMFSSRFPGWRILDVATPHNHMKFERVTTVHCEHEEGYEATFIVRIDTSTLRGDDFATQFVNQVGRQINLLSIAINPIPAEAVNAPEVLEDESSVWTPEHCPEVWR